MASARAKFDAADRMGALALWEAALKADPDDAQRLAALYNATVVHAGFGDVELAQITLREAVQRGLDFGATVADPEAADPAFVRLVASQQVLVRLRKFEAATRKAMGAAAAPPPSAGAGRRGAGRPSMMDRDLSAMLETDMQGIDTSIGGIVRRVAVLLLVLSGAGVALFAVGIKYLFPEAE